MPARDYGWLPLFFAGMTRSLSRGRIWQGFAQRGIFVHFRGPFMKMMRVVYWLVVCLTISVFSGLLFAQQGTAATDLPSETPAKLVPVTDTFDYVKRDVMIPMRDGVKLHTVIVIPKGAKNAPILLTRTPYNASAQLSHAASSHMIAALPQGDEVFAAAGYIRVFQDVRGKYKSEGDYVMTRPPRGPLNDRSEEHTAELQSHSFI